MIHLERENDRSPHLPVAPRDGKGHAAHTPFVSCASTSLGAKAPSSRHHAPASLQRDRRGATIVEFALIAPVFLGLLMGMFDIGHQLYVTAALQGSVQKAARDSSLESSTDATAQAAFDKRVTNSIYALSNTAKVKITRRFYRTFTEAEAAPPESWTDSNNNDRCDNKEAYQDENNNNVWDADGGDAGQGSAKDRTVYTVSVTYPRLFPFWSYFGVPNAYNVSARTVLQNQPYNDQQSYGAGTVRNCA